jgi:hypothetical protein
MLAGVLSQAWSGQAWAQDRPRLAHDRAFLYWGAHDCGPCRAWEHDHLDRVKGELEALGVRVLVLKKPRIVDPWIPEHLGGDPLALAIHAAQSAPRSTPHFTYVAGGLRLIDIPGYERSKWALSHERAVKRLFVRPFRQA